MKKGTRFLKIFAVAMLGLLLVGIVTMTLWNWLVPVIFNGPSITFWQALGLLVLSKILFSSWGAGRCKPNSHEWKQRYMEKLASMTPQDRERFKQRMRDKWCHNDPAQHDFTHTND